MHYKGTLTNGVVFDSSYERGAPATFVVNQVIPGWTEALQLMKPGDQWLLYLPANIAYGPPLHGQHPSQQRPRFPGTPAAGVWRAMRTDPT